MIYNQWYIILDSKEVKRNKPLKITRLNQTLAVWRDDDNQVHCIDDRCCHRGASLSCGKVVNGQLECPFHGFLFNGEGRVTTIPANGRNTKVPDSMHVKDCAIHEDYGYIWMWYGDKDKIKSPPFFWDELKDFTYSGFVDPWSVHYSRAIENQLDVVHIPFVHKTTIGRGNKTLVNGPVVIREGEMITFYVDNMVDDGHTKPLKPDEITNYKELFYLQFHFPNIWQNFISDKIRTTAAFVPVDEENSLIYIRYYQRVSRLPGIRHLINYVGKVVSIIILRQDKRVVTTQLPKKSAVHMDERLIMGDKPIIEYRKHRQVLMEQSTSVPSGY